LLHNKGIFQALLLVILLAYIFALLLKCFYSVNLVAILKMIWISEYAVRGTVERFFRGTAEHVPLCPAVQVCRVHL